MPVHYRSGRQIVVGDVVEKLIDGKGTRVHGQIWAINQGMTRVEVMYSGDFLPTIEDIVELRPLGDT